MNKLLKQCRKKFLFFFKKPIAISENCDIIIDKKSENKQKSNKREEKRQ